MKAAHEANASEQDIFHRKPTGSVPTRLRVIRLKPIHPAQGDAGDRSTKSNPFNS